MNVNMINHNERHHNREQQGVDGCREADTGHCQCLQGVVKQSQPT